MFTLLVVIFSTLRYLNNFLEYRHKIVAINIFFLLTLIISRLENKKISDSFIRRHYVLKNRQEIAAANEPPTSHD